MSRTVKAPDGTRWEVRRPLLSQAFRRAIGAPKVHAGEDSGAQGILGALVVGLLFGVLLNLVFWLVGWLFLPFALLVRATTRRWPVEATSDGQTLRWHAPSGAAADEAVAQIADALERGEAPAPANATRA